MQQRLKRIARNYYHLALLKTGIWALDYFNWAVKKIPPSAFIKR